MLHAAPRDYLAFCCKWWVLVPLNLHTEMVSTSLLLLKSKVSYFGISQTTDADDCVLLKWKHTHCFSHTKKFLHAYCQQHIKSLMKTLDRGHNNVPYQQEIHFGDKAFQFAVKKIYLFCISFAFITMLRIFIFALVLLQFLKSLRASYES